MCQCPGTCVKFRSLVGHRFGNPSQLPSNLTKYKPFAERFVASFAPEILKVYLRLTEANIAGTWLSRKAVHFIFMYYTEW